MYLNNSLLKNAIFNILYKLLNVLFPLISSSYVSHILFARGVGKVSYAQNISQYFVLLAPLGLINYGTKQIARLKNSTNKANIIFSELFIINFISTTVCVIGYYVLIFFHPYFKEDKTLFLVTGLAIVFNYINIEWFYQGCEEFKYIAIRSLVIKTISIIAVFLFVKQESDYLAYAFIYTLAIGGNYFLNILRLSKFGVKFSIIGINPEKHLKPVIILLLNSIAIELYTLFDTSMLGYICDEVVVGYYSNAIKVVRIWVSVITAISGVLLPRLTYYHNRGLERESSKIVNSVMSILIYCILPSIVGLVILAEPIILVLYGDAFVPAIHTLQMASILIFALSYSYLFGTQILITYGREKTLFFCSLAGAIINIVLNLILIPLFFQNGAVIASIICELVVMILMYLSARKCIYIVCSLKDIFLSVSFSLVMGTEIHFIGRSVNNNTYKLIIGIISGMICYIFLNLVFNKKSRVIFYKIMTNRIQKCKKGL